jgi:hypothetical protein
VSVTAPEVKPEAGAPGVPAGAVSVGGLPAPPRLRRRPLLVVGGVAATCLGALLALWVWSAAGTARDVVAVRSDVDRGEVITREDLLVVRVGVDPALDVVSGSRLESLVGQRAVSDLVAGGLVTRRSVAASVVPEDGTSVVGVSLAGGLLPGEPLRAGDEVRVVATPGDQGEVAEGDQLRVIEAFVVGVRADEVSGESIVSVQVPSEDAPELAARAATGRVALVLDARER